VSVGTAQGRGITLSLVIDVFSSEGETMKLTNSLGGRNLGMLLLGIWLILTGLIPLLNVRLSSTMMTALAVLAIVAGILILLRR
jgi:VIT1/CCC1 family predicted Fe2+/Mn2+ transporter